MEPNTVSTPASEASSILISTMNKNKGATMTNTMKSDGHSYNPSVDYDHI